MEKSGIKAVSAIAAVLAVSCSAFFGFSEYSVTASAAENLQSSGTQYKTVLVEKHIHTFSNAWTKDNDYHWHSATCGHDTVQGKAPHEWDGGRVTTPVTDTKDGIVTYACEVCGAQKAVRIPAGTGLEHTHKAEEKWSFDENGHWHRCGECSDRLDYSKHVENSGVVTVKPTAVSEGEMTYRCRICGAVTRTEKLPAEGGDTADTAQPQRTAEVQPLLLDSEGCGWEAVSREIASAEDGGTVAVDMNGARELPKAVAESFQGRNVDLVVKMKSGVKWTINGENITDPRSVNLNVIKDARTHISDELLADVSKGSESIKQLSLNYNGYLGFTGTLNIDFGKKYDGLFANVYSYNSKEKTLELVDCCPVERGEADIRFSHASEYAVVLSAEPAGLYEDVAAGGGMSLNGGIISVDTDRTAPLRWYGLSLAAGALSAAAAFVLKRYARK